MADTGSIELHVLPVGAVPHPAFHKKNLLTFLNGGPIALAGCYVKVRRDGYKAWAANP